MRPTDGKAVIQQLFDAFNADRFEDWRDLLAPTFTLNDRQTTAEAYMEFGRSLKLADSENEITVEELIEEGERVVARLRSSGRHQSRFLGYEPTNRTYTNRGVYIFTVHEGRIREAWDVWDFLGQLVQLGLWPPPGHTL